MLPYNKNKMKSPHYTGMRQVRFVAFLGFGFGDGETNTRGTRASYTRREHNKAHGAQGSPSRSLTNNCVIVALIGAALNGGFSMTKCVAFSPGGSISPCIHVSHISCARVYP